jgi:hypothetical protein
VRLLLCVRWLVLLMMLRLLLLMLMVLLDIERLPTSVDLLPRWWHHHLLWVLLWVVHVVVLLWEIGLLHSLHRDALHRHALLHPHLHLQVALSFFRYGSCWIDQQAPLFAWIISGTGTSRC